MTAVTRLLRLAALAFLAGVILAACGRDPTAPPPFVEATVTCTLTALTDSLAVSSCQ